MSCDEIDDFCQQIIEHSQFKSGRIFKTGSNVEIDGQEAVLGSLDLDSNFLTDLDIMYYTTYLYAFPLNLPVQEKYNGELIRIYSAGRHSGYTKLYKEDDNEIIEFNVSDTGTDTELENMHGPAELVSRPEAEMHLLKRYPKLTFENLRASLQNKIKYRDAVFAIHSPYWPVEAYEWVTRLRPYDSPSKSTMKEVIRYGCDFVAVSHKLSDDNNEWRFSFSKAELVIIHNWTKSQRTIYRLLNALHKKIKSRMDDTALCTYYFKTLMMWATEEKHPDFWAEDVLVNSVFELVNNLMKCLAVKLCPNYFIPSNNMIDHLTHTDLNADIEALYQICQTRELIVNVSNNSRDVEVLGMNQTFCVKLPMWIGTSLVIQDRICNREDTFKNLSCNDSLSQLSNIARFELASLFKSLSSTAAECCNYSVETICTIQAIDDLSTCQKTQDIIELNCCRNVADESLVSWFLNNLAHDSSDDDEEQSCISGDTTDRDEKPNSLKDNKKQTDWCLLIYTRSMGYVNRSMSISRFSDVKDQENELCITSYWHAKATDGEIYTDVAIYNELPGKSPTVNISWFITKAYIANLYYRTQHNYSATEEICDEIIDIYKQSACNQEFAEKNLPVVLTTQWTSAYDKDLQVILGLYSMCCFIFYKPDRRRSVYLGVCPVQFALYLKSRCAAAQLLIDRSENCMQEYNEHWKICESDRRVNNGSLVMSVTLRVIVLTFNRYSVSYNI